MKKLNNYLNLCTQVYDMKMSEPQEEAYAFYRHYAKQANGLILEPMCGAGQYLIPLLEEGFDIYGFDASTHMLAKLYEKTQKKNLKPNTWYGFVQELNRPERFSLIFIPKGSFCLITDENEVNQALKTFYQHLTETGVLLLEIVTPKAVPALGVWRGSMYPRSDGTTILLSQLAMLDSGICKSFGKYELLSEGKIAHTELEEYKIKIYEQDEFVNIIKAAGFTQIRAIKAFNLNQQPDKDDESIIYECRK